MSKKQLVLLVVLTAIISLTGCRSAHVTSSILYIDQTLYTKAITVLHEGLDYTPDEAEAFFFLGEAHSKRSEVAIRENDFLAAKKDYEMAFGYYMRAIELNPSLKDQAYESMLFNYTQRSNDAKNEFRSNYYEAAEGYFQLAYAAMPDSVAPIKNIARMKIKLASEDNNADLLNEALVLLDQVIEKSPEAYLLKTDKATVLTKLGRNEEASLLYDNLLQEHPDDTDLLIDVARLSEADEKLEHAAELYVRVIDIYETDEDPLNDEEVYYLALQAAVYFGDASILRYQEAIDLYEKALRLEPLPEENTMMQKLKLHYDYAKRLKDEAEFETGDAKTEKEQLATEHLTSGVGVGNALINSYLESSNGYFYLGLCYLELGDTANGEKSLSIYRQLQGTN
jgi:tetratricopeptide (TPR) repeat protein